jgi:hypothetical protein
MVAGRGGDSLNNTGQESNHPVGLVLGLSSAMKKSVSSSEDSVVPSLPSRESIVISH